MQHALDNLPVGFPAGKMLKLLRNLPRGAYFVVGTDTEIGKTHAVEMMITALRSLGFRALAMKPVAAGVDAGRTLNDDVARLMAASGQTDAALMNPYCFREPISPHLAAAREHVVIDFAKISQHYEQLLAQADYLFVEGAGGFRTPISQDADLGDLAIALNLPVILVVGLQLGCLNHALLTLESMQARGLTLAGWVANVVDPLMPLKNHNIAYLDAKISAPRLATLPFLRSDRLKL